MQQVNRLVCMRVCINWAMQPLDTQSLSLVTDYCHLLLAYVIVCVCDYVCLEADCLVRNYLTVGLLQKHQKKNKTNKTQ